MIKHTENNFAGYDCISLSNDQITLHIMKTAGPRIIGLQIGEGQNLMAVVPVEDQKDNEFILRGGHRLWHGPEDLVRTYMPDNEPISYKYTDQGIILTQKTESATGIQKSIEIIMPNYGTDLTLKHSLINHNLWAVSLTAWPITQVRAGGFAILPLSTEDTNPVPNRRLVFWPYTDIKSKNIVLSNRYMFFKAQYQGKEFAKLGWLNDRSWFGYYIDRTLFIKRAQFVPDGNYTDLGCSMESFCDKRYLEMETMSPLTTIEPGTKLVYNEEWSIYSDIDLNMQEEHVDEVIKKLNIE